MPHVHNKDHAVERFPGLEVGAEQVFPMLTDCSRFECTGKRNARIEWDIAAGEGEAADGWPAWTRRWRSLKSDRVLYGRDVGLDTEALGGLCAFLNQLRDEALANR